MITCFLYSDIHKNTKKNLQSVHALHVQKNEQLSVLHIYYTVDLAFFPTGNFLTGYTYKFSCVVDILAYLYLIFVRHMRSIIDN